MTTKPLAIAAALFMLSSPALAQMAAPPPPEPPMAPEPAMAPEPPMAAPDAMGPKPYPPCRGAVRDGCDQTATSEHAAMTAAEAEATGGVGDRNRDQAAMMGGGKARAKRPR